MKPSSLYPSRVQWCTRGVGSLRQWLLAICVVLPLFFQLFETHTDVFYLTRSALSGGAYHVLWSGHFLHFTFEHFLWDTLVYWMLLCVLWRQEGERVLVWLLVAMPLMSIALFASDSTLYEYRGLSGVDSLLYARVGVGFCYRLSSWGRWLFGYVPLAGFFGKTVYEVVTGSTLFVSDLGEGVVALPFAHLLGFGVGCVWAFSRSSTLRPRVLGPAETAT